MNNIEYALITKFFTHCECQENRSINELTLASMRDDTVIPIESFIYLSVIIGDYTQLYCCNSETYKCLTSAIVHEENHNISKGRYKMNKSQQRQYILSRVQEWAGSYANAQKWFDEERLPALGCTPKDAIECGEFDALNSYLDTISLGGYA
jgi:hypothetical protein